jgi:DNA-binding beta-propeller fold protein YncE
VAGKLYWANYGNNTISYANLDGSGGGDLSTTGATINGPSGVAIDPATGRIYWTNFDGTTISYAKLDGSGGGELTKTGATVSFASGLAIDAATGKIYWTNYSGANTISFATWQRRSGRPHDHRHDR